MRMLVLGGKLQGTEVIYLAKKAGMYVTLIDKNTYAPAAKLADRFVEADILTDEENVLSEYERADIVFPVIEDMKVLRKAMDFGKKTNTPVIFDPEAYRISSSKKLSNDLFEELNLPMPKKYPDCDYPVIVKPDGKSGSVGVIKACSQEEVESYLKSHPGENPIIQEFVEGPSYSLEVIGDGEHFFFPQITEVCVDQDYDCKRIIAPARVNADIAKQMRQIGEKLAEKIKINGIFDIEVINHNGTLKLLEIDARFPSQTPISVYHSTGINMVKVLAEMKLYRKTTCRALKKPVVCLYQQVLAGKEGIRVLGEHIMAEAGHLKRIENFFGADEAMTDYDPVNDHPDFRSIVIITRDSYKEAYKAFHEFLFNLAHDGLSGEAGYDKISA